MNMTTAITRFSSGFFLACALGYAFSAHAQTDEEIPETPPAQETAAPENPALVDLSPSPAAPAEEDNSPEVPSPADAVPTPLFFPAEKNNLQILPQKFEYALMDENTTRIGDILIDATRLNFQILPTKDGKYRLRFTWPAGLLIEGHIILKDSTGKAIVAEEINPKNVKIRKGAKADGSEKLRSEIAEFISAPLLPSVIEDMKFVPFMTFCVYRESLATRIFLCSKELYLAAQADPKARPAVKYRASQKKTAAVEINRQKVGERGLIFLNDPKENLVFKSFSQSGSTLQIETRRRKIDFKDVVSTKDSILIRMAGTDPVDETSARKLGDKDWELKIPKSRPIIYLKGDGDIPMRQEFLVKGTLPRRKDRPVLTHSPSSRTYSSSFEVTGEIPAQSTVEALDKESHVRMIDGTHFEWSSHSLPPNTTTRRYLAINREGHKQVVGYDVLRGLPFEFSAGASVLMPSALFYGRLGFQWWLDNFLGIDSAATHLHWGLNLEQVQHLTTKADRVKLDLTNLELLYRFESGFHLQDPTWGLLLPVQMAKTDGGSATLFGLGLFGIRQAPDSVQSWLSWYTVKLRYYLSSSGADVKVKQAYQFDLKTYTPMSENFFITGGLGLSLYKFDPAAVKEDNQFQLEAGVAYRF